MKPQTRLYAFVALTLVIQLIVVLQSSRLEESAQRALQAAQAIKGDCHAKG